MFSVLPVFKSGLKPRYLQIFVRRKGFKVAVPMKTGPQSSEAPGEPLSSETKSPPPASKVGSEEGMDGDVKDDLRSVNVALPRLPEEDAHQAALKYSDWIAEITPLVHDVSSFAGQWWKQLMEHVGQVYKQWLTPNKAHGRG